MKDLTKNELINELEIKIKEDKEISKNLEKTNKKLKESEFFKSNFISNITNEIVNLFSSILGLSKNIISVKEEIAAKINSGSVFTISIPEAKTIDIEGFAVDGNEFFFDGDNEVF